MNNQERFDKAVSAYLSDSASKGVSAKTMRNYKSRLAYFREYLETEQTGSFLAPNVEAVRGWRDSLLAKGLSATTVKQYMVELKAFFEYATDDVLHEEPFYEKNPVSKKLFPMTSSEEKKPYDKILTNEDIEKLWINRPNTSSKKWARNYAIITLLLDGKIRNAELLDIRLKDIDFEYKEVIIHKGKGNKYRVVTLTDISLTAIKLYLKSGCRPDYCTEDDYLFGTTANHTFGRKGKSTEKWHRGSSQWLSSLVESHVKAVTGKEGFRSHSMRHNGAVIDLNTGSSMERIQSELGHASITTTELYAGRLQPVRHAREMQEVIKARDEWAERNMEALAKKRA